MGVISNKSKPHLISLHVCNAEQEFCQNPLVLSELQQPDKWKDTTSRYAFTSNTVQRIHKNFPKSPEVATCLKNIWTALRKAVSPRFSHTALHSGHDSKKGGRGVLSRFLAGMSHVHPWKHITWSFLRKSVLPYPTPCNTAWNTADGGFYSLSMYEYSVWKESLVARRLVVQCPRLYVVCR
jgi:hypothetical protein